MDLSSMYLHFGKQAEFVCNLAEQQIQKVESIGEKKYNTTMMEQKTLTV